MLKVQELNVGHSRIILCMEVSENNATNTVMARNLFWLLICTWYMGSRWYTSDLHIEEIGVGGDSLLHVSVCCKFLSSQVLLKGSKEMEISGFPIANQICDWLRWCGWKVMDHASCTSFSCPMISVSLDRLRSIWLVSGLWWMLTWSRLSLPHHSTWYWFLLYRDASLGPWWDKWLNVSGDYMGGVICTICYPSAVCTSRSE